MSLPVAIKAVDGEATIGSKSRVCYVATCCYQDRGRKAIIGSKSRVNYVATCRYQGSGRKAIIGSKSRVDYIAMSQPIAVKTVDGKAIPIFLPPLWKINNIPLFLPHGYPAA
ncbi:MAG: hypothetical protein RR253_03970 [Oscillospiraceae bacterium]